jgi:hypothetical protein
MKKFSLLPKKLVIALCSLVITKFLNLNIAINIKPGVNVRRIEISERIYFAAKKIVRRICRRLRMTGSERIGVLLYRGSTLNGL